MHHRTLANLPDGTFSLEEAAEKIRGFDPQGHLPKTRHATHQTNIESKSLKNIFTCHPGSFA